MRARRIGAVALTGVVALVLAGCGSSSSSGSSTATTAGGSAGSSSAGSSSAGNDASATGVTATTIKIGYISSLTGVASSSFADGPAGAEARIDAINAAGGIDGRKIQLVSVDDSSTPAGDATASQELATTKGVFGVIDFSSFTFGGARVLQQKGIPVTGESFDAGEWGEQPYSNMFSFLPPTYTPYAGKYYNYDYFAKFLKQVGVTKVAGLSYGISPSSQASANAALAGGLTQGIKTCYNNTSVPFGGVDFTSDVLAIKSAGCNGVVGSFVDSSDVALSTALAQAGSKAKQLYYTGYDQTTLASSAAQAAFKGDYFSSDILFDPAAVPAVGTMFADFKKYDPSYKAGTIPDFGAYGSYVAADLMIKGLELAGKNPTRGSFITNLRKVTSYNAGGLLPSGTSFANFGTPAMVPATECYYFVQLQGDKFVNVEGGSKTICGSRISFKA
jgi:branched-chain amino acid transport system substrate-binding protein